MALPSLQKSYAGGISPCNLVVFASAAQCYADEVFAFIAFMKAHGWECVGSSNGAAAAMDGPGTDRIASAANWATRGANTVAAQSWWIGKRTDAAMGGVRLMLAYEGAAANTLKISYSIGGFTIAGTPTFQPTDANQVVLAAANSSLDGGAASIDRRWSAWQSTDGNVMMWAIARNGVWQRWTRLEVVDASMVVAPATFSPAVVGFSVVNSINHALFLAATPTAVCRANGGGGAAGLTLYGAVEGYKSGIGPATVTFAPEMQGGGGFLFWPMGWWSEVAGARGKVGNSRDMWAGLAAHADGDTYPSSGFLRQFICMGPYLVPWDAPRDGSGNATGNGSTVVMI